MKIFKGIRKWIKGFDNTKSKYDKKPNGYSKSIQFSDNERLQDGRHAWFKKNGEMVRRSMQ